MIKKLFFLSMSASFINSSIHASEARVRELESVIKRLTGDLEMERRKQNIIYINNSPSNEFTNYTSTQVAIRQLLFASLQEKTQAAKSYIAQHKAKIALSALAGTYGSLVLAMLYARATLKKLKWANWHRSDSMKKYLLFRTTNLPVNSFSTFNPSIPMLIIQRMSNILWHNFLFMR